MNISPWKRCLERLEGNLSPQQFNTWIRPLHVVEEEKYIQILAPNRFVLDWINERYLPQIEKILKTITDNSDIHLSLKIGSHKIKKQDSENINLKNNTLQPSRSAYHHSVLNNDFTFENFVEGKSNQLARAASIQVAKNPGLAYNPLLLYGNVGLGKTHIMHAINHAILQEDPSKNVTYIHSEKFVADMVRALQHNLINDFKHYYRSLDILLIDDIQFFAGKERSQEEFFHTFNTLLEGQNQIVLTCDRYPKEVNGLENRLKSRFGWGLSVTIAPPEFETRVAIINKKAEQSQISISEDVAFFIAKRFRSNVRELEGALNRVVANARLTGKDITLEFTKTTLQDLLLIQDRQISIDNIKKTVAEHYKIRVSDLLSKRRSRSIARPRQMAMAIAKELTNFSLPEIGDVFNGRDHTTVIHACRKIDELCKTDMKIQEDYTHLINILTS